MSHVCWAIRKFLFLHSFTCLLLPLFLLAPSAVYLSCNVYQYHNNWIFYIWMIVFLHEKSSIYIFTWNAIITRCVFFKAKLFSKRPNNFLLVCRFNRFYSPAQFIGYCFLHTLTVFKLYLITLTGFRCFGQENIYSLAPSGVFSHAIYTNFIIIEIQYFLK